MNKFSDGNGPGASARVGCLCRRQCGSDDDGTIDLKEADAGALKVFKEINPDNDGTLDAKELEGRLTEAELKAADPDNDGTLDEKEYLAVVKKKFEAANPDNDGTVDLKELESPAGQELLKLIYK